jgi:hypothetical protein
VCNGVPIDEGKTDWKGSCTFAKAGTYRYYCFVHGMKMSGTINVNPGATTPTTTPTTTMPTMTSSPGGGATTTSPTSPPGEPGPGQASGSPLMGSASKAFKLARTQRGESVRGSVQISQAGIGARLEVDLLASAASLARAGHSAQVRVGRLLRSSSKAGSAPFSVPLSARGRAALRRHRRLALTVKITLTPAHGAAVRVTRVVVLHA